MRKLSHRASNISQKICCHRRLSSSWGRGFWLQPITNGYKFTQVTFFEGTPVSSDSNVPYLGPHWVDEVNVQNPTDEMPDGEPDVDQKPAPDNLKSLPYSYASNFAPRVEAKFKLINPHNFHPVEAWGVSVTPGCQFAFPKKRLNNGVYPMTAADRPIITNRKIKCFTTPNRMITRNGAPQQVSLDIRWTVRFNGHPVDIDAGISKHTIYVTYGPPQTSLRQETLFSIACGMADGQSPASVGGRAGIATAVYSEFTDRIVKRMDNRALTFYHGVAINTNASMLLQSASADGQCGAFSDILKNALVLGGVSAGRFSIKHVWTGVSGSLNDDQLLTKNTTFNQSSLTDPPSESFTHRYPNDVATATGIQGQGPVDPFIKVFNQHIVVVYLDRIYDPSYGAPVVMDALNYEAQTFDGYTKFDRAHRKVVARVEVGSELETIFTPIP